MNKHWIGLAVVVLGSFSVLRWMGTLIYQEALSIPERSVDATGKTRNRAFSPVFKEHSERNRK